MSQPKSGESKLSPELEQAVREAARACCPDCVEGSRPKAGLHGYTSDGFPMVCRQPAWPILRSLVLRATREAAKLNMDKLTAMEQIVIGFPWWFRCDWCGWDLKTLLEDGCIWNSCSMRPMPRLSAQGEVQQWVRHYVHEVHALAGREGEEKHG